MLLRLGRIALSAKSVWRARRKYREQERITGAVVWALRPEDKGLRLLLDAFLQQKKEDGSLAALITRSLPFYSETELFPDK